MFEWVLKNKEWLFSGVGVTLLVALYSFIRHLRHGNKAATHSGHEKKSFALVPNDIRDAVKQAPPLQRYAVGQRFIGLPVDWLTEFAGAEEREGNVRVHLRTLPANMLDLDRTSVFCDVQLDGHPELAVLHRGAKVQARGKVGQVRNGIVSLDDVKLSFPG